ncbi:MAG: hypothetical protein Q7R78_00550 [bacterium]|nr:hypothetical protein [bacterium]
MSTNITETLSKEIEDVLNKNPGVLVTHVGNFTLVKEGSDAIKDHSGKTFLASIIHEKEGQFRVYLG